MKRFHPTATAVLILVLPLMIAAAVAPSLDRLFPMEADILAPRPGLVRLPLPPAVLSQTRAGLSDLRVFDRAGREIPYLVDGWRRDGKAVEAKESFDSRVVGLQRDITERETAPNIHHEEYVIAAPPEAPEGGSWDLVFEVGAPRFARSVKVMLPAAKVGASSQPHGDLLAQQSLFRLDAETRRTRVSLPRFRADTLIVVIEGEEGFYLEPGFRFESRRLFAPLNESVVPLEVLSIEQRDGRTELEVARPAGIVPDRLRFSSATGSFQRALRVFDQQPGRPDREIGKGKIFRLGALGVAEVEVHVLHASGSSLRVDISDRDAPALESLEVSAVMRQPVLVFDLPKGGAEGDLRAVLRFGGGRAHRPHYQLQALLLGARETLSGKQAEAAISLYDPARIGTAQIGPIRSNPRFDASPALAFAMHPGAEIDTRVFSHQRSLSIDPSKEGLSSVVLEPEDVARSRADLADIRITGADDRQWPYLMERAAVTRWLPISLVSTESKRRVTTFTFGVPEAPLHASQLTLRFEAPFFDRAYRLFAIDENGDRDPIQSGRLVKDGRRPKPAKISFSAPIHGLELEVDDGDDAPLSFESAQVRVRLPRLFLAAPKDGYTLWIGNPDARAPRYELERVRDVVLAVSSRSASSEALERNPGYSLTARIGSGDGAGTWLQTVGVWSVLVLAVVVLGALTLRVVRQEPPPKA